MDHGGAKKLIDAAKQKGIGRYAIVSCEFSGQLLKLDVRRERILASLVLPGHAIPQDVRLAPNGRLFYVADLAAAPP